MERNIPKWLSASAEFGELVRTSKISPSGAVAGHLQNALVPYTGEDDPGFGEDRQVRDAWIEAVLRSAASTVTAWTKERVTVGTQGEQERNPRLVVSPYALLRMKAKPTDAVDYATGRLLVGASSRKYLSAGERVAMRKASWMNEVASTTSDGVSKGNAIREYAAATLAGAVASVKGREMVLAEWPGWGGYFKAAQSQDATPEALAEYVANPKTPPMLKVAAAIAHEIGGGSPLNLGELEPARVAGMQYLNAARWAKGKFLENARNMASAIEGALPPREEPPESRDDPEGDSENGDDGETPPGWDRIPDSEPDRMREMDGRDRSGVYVETHADVSAGRPSGIPGGGSGCDEFEVLEQPVRGSAYGIARMKERAKPLVSALERIAWASLSPIELERARDRGSVDEGALHRLALHGDTDVFECPPDEGTPTIALSLLVDCSGSMNAATDRGSSEYRTTRIGDATAVAFAIASVFGKRSNFRIHVAGHHEHRGRVIYQPCEGGPDGIAGLDAYGNNADGHAIAHAVGRVRAVPATRRVVVLVADGYPSAPGYGGNAGMRHVRNVIEGARWAGVEFLAIGVEGCLDASTARAMYGPGRFVDIGPVRNAGPFLGRYLARFAGGTA